MRLTSKLGLKIAVIVFAVFFSIPVYGQNFQSNGYDVDMNWRVKGKYLRVFGDIEEGRACWKLKVNVDMGNKIHNLATSLTAYTGQHNPQGRTMFNAKNNLGRDYKAVKGWYVKKLAVYCVGKK